MDWNDELLNEGSIYEEDVIFDMVENDEISPEEAGFMYGYTAS